MQALGVTCTFQIAQSHQPATSPGPTRGSKAGALTSEAIRAGASGNAAQPSAPSVIISAFRSYPAARNAPLTVRWSGVSVVTCQLAALC